MLHGIQKEDLYADDSKVDEDGHVYKFSVLDQERNLFRFPGNKFLPKLGVYPDLKYARGLFMWQYIPKCPTARPKLTGSHKTIAEELCQP